MHTPADDSLKTFWNISGTVRNVFFDIGQENIRTMIAHDYLQAGRWDKDVCK